LEHVLPPIVRFEDYQADLQTGELRKNGTKIRLSGQPFQILALLLEKPGELITREELRTRLWPDEVFIDFDHSLNAAVNKLREALCDSTNDVRFIETLPKRGYRFIAPVYSASVPSQHSTPEVAAPGIQIHAGAGEIKPAKINESDGSNEISSSVLSDSPAKFVPPKLTPPFPLRSKTFSGNRRLQVSAALALGIVFAVVAMGAMFLFSSRSATHNLQSPIRSVAVLPLENLTGDPTQEYFADGMTDALITELAQVRGLKVISRTSVMHYKGARKTLPEIARELSVDAVVEGTVTRSGEDVKITAQLIRASTDNHLWAASFAGLRQDIPSLQAKVAREVTRQISDQLLPAENNPGSKTAVNAEAYDDYLKGVYFLNQQSPDGVRTAIRYFQAAVEKDRNFAAAYSRLASCYGLLASMSEIPPVEAYARGKEAAQKAAALDDNLDQAHTDLAWIAVLDWDWTRAENEYKRAIQINPNSVETRVSYFYLLLILGKSEESAQEERAATMLDPLSFDTLMLSIANDYYRRQYNEGVPKARSAIELYPRVSAFHVFLSNFYTAQGRDKSSAEEILRAEETGGASLDRLAALKVAFEAAGAKGLRRKRIELNEKLAGKQAANSYDLAIDCAAIGDGDQALVWLERAFQAHESKIILIGVEPIFDSIHSDPRFASLLNQMGLSPKHA
jgi:TolB-like protein/DNA-binding winged helix-turn-helix (wHTH) protein